MTVGEFTALVVSRSFPGGEVQWQFQYEFLTFIKVVMSSDEHNIIRKESFISYVLIHVKNCSLWFSKV